MEIEERGMENPAGGEKQGERERERETKCGVRCVRPTYIYGVSRAYSLFFGRERFAFVLKHCTNYMKN